MPTRSPAPAGLHTSSIRLPVEGKLPSLEGATGWLNSPPQTATELSGRIVLVNFWTIDNDYAVWRAFENHYWPALYLADTAGRIRHHHFGEGEYRRSEMVIQQLLVEAELTDHDHDPVSVNAVGAEARRTGPPCGHRRPTPVTRAPATSPLPAASGRTGGTNTLPRPS
jgi:hypothetical protein